MKLTPSSTARRKTFFAFSRSGGQPQIPSPVNRIAPNPSRSTVISPPNRNVDLVAAAAVTSFGNPPAKIVTPPVSVTPRNFLRVRSWSIAKRNIHRHRPQMPCHAEALRVGASHLANAGRLQDLSSANSYFLIRPSYFPTG